jgi:hypothetical protein
MRKDAASRIEREFKQMNETNPLFRDYCLLHPDSSMEELLAGFGWVQKLVEKAIARTIRDLTCAHPGDTLPLRRKEIY